MTRCSTQPAAAGHGDFAVAVRSDRRAPGITSLVMLIVACYYLSTTRADVAVDPAVLEAQNERIQVIERIAPSVVAIFAQGSAGGGSGVLVTADGFALTNFHVVTAAGLFMKCGLNDGVLYDAVIVGADPTGDVAMIKLLGRDDFPHAKLGDSDQLCVGDEIFALGNPFLLATDFQPTVTHGIVSGMHRYQYPAGTLFEYTDCIQVDASINPGNSGGPLFNRRGELVGINGRISTDKRGRVNSGVGYAISINQIKNFWDHLQSGRIVDHATLGATVQSQEDGSVIVDSILESSPAYRRGLQLGDEIVSFMHRPIRSANQFKNILGIYPKGWVVPLVYRRDEQKHEIYVRLQGLHKSGFVPPPSPHRTMPLPHPFQPKPGKPGEPHRPGHDPSKNPHSQPGHPFPRPFHQAPTIPEKFQKLYEKREGFANYYFNQLAQERLLKSLEGLGDFQVPFKKWSIAGKDQAGKPFELTMTDQAVALEWGSEAYYQPVDDKDFLDEPRGSGGLLAALHQVRLLLTQGTEPFTDCYYLGSEPFDRTNRRVDVLISELAEVQSRWYFGREPAEFLGVDVRLEPNADPCELRFQGAQVVEGRTFPEHVLVRHGELDFVNFQLQDIKLFLK